jgi:hypothetical protein
VAAGPVHSWPEFSIQQKTEDETRPLGVEEIVQGPASGFGVDAPLPHEFVDCGKVTS